MDESADERDQLDVIIGCLSLLSLLIGLAATGALIWGAIALVRGLL